MSITLGRAAAWFEWRAKNTPMAGARTMFEMAGAALREKSEREAPLPLTEEEMRQMVGEPVWTVGVSSNGGTWAGWDIIESVDDDGCYFGYSTEKPEWWAYGLRNPDGALCGCAWIAYRHKPKEG